MTNSYYLQSPDGKRLTIFEGENSVGRLSTNKIVVRHTNVSGKHALIVKQGNFLWVEDRNSANGTFVNERRLINEHRQRLNKGDRIKFSSGVAFEIRQRTENNPRTQRTGESGKLKRVDPKYNWGPTAPTEHGPPDYAQLKAPSKLFSPEKKIAIVQKPDNVPLAKTHLPVEASPDFMANDKKTNVSPLGSVHAEPQSHFFQTAETEKHAQPQQSLYLKQQSSIYSEPTRLLSAAAHLNPWIYDQFEAYDKEKYKAHLPEYYIDIETIRAEARRGRERERIRRFAHLAIMIFVLLFTWLTGAFVLSLLIAWLTAWAVNVLFDYSRQRYVREHFLKINSHRDYQIKPDAQNVIIYDGFEPFVGAGVEVGKWSLTVDMTKAAKSEQPPKQITESELFTAIGDEICKLNIPQLHQKDLLFVSGRDLREQTLILPDTFDKPQTKIDDKLVLQYMGNRDDLVRHYRMIQVPIWNGQMVLSIFLRITQEGHNLFVESNTRILPPISAAYSKVDRFTGRIGLRTIGAIFMKNIFISPFSWFKAISWIASRVIHEIDLIFDRQASEIRRDFRYDYGRKVSFRERWSDNTLRRHYQESDLSMYVEILTERLLDAIADSLVARGISVKKLRSQSQTIFNQGLVIHGGNVKAGGNAEAVNISVEAAASIRSLFSDDQSHRNRNQSMKGKMNP